MQLIVLDQQGDTAPLLQVTGHDGSEITGPALDPRRRTLHFSSQRGVTGTQRRRHLRGDRPLPPDLTPAVLRLRCFQPAALRSLQVGHTG